MLKKISFSVFIFFALLATLSSPTPAQLTKSDPTSNLSLENLAIDETLGKVEERFVGNPGRVIVQVQDVHAHYTAQENIAAILEHLSSVCGNKKVALEGAWTLTELPKSRAIPTSREKQLLARSLMERDLISGPIYAALLSPAPFTLLGIEDPVRYEKNRTLFLKHLPMVGEIEAKLKVYEKQFRDAETTLFGPDLIAFSDAFGKFRAASDFGKFFSILFKTASALSVSFEDLSQIVLFQNMMSLEKEITKVRLEAEVQRLMREYKNTSWNLEELVRGGKIPPEKAGLYPEIMKFSKLLKIQDKVVLRELMSQLETLTGRILEKLVRTPDEKALWDKSERFYLMKKVLLLEASPSDLAALEKEWADINVDLQSANLGEEMSVSLEFYALVKERDKIFFDKLLNDPVFSGSLAIVTGGFHTAGLSAQLRDAGISYITVSPDLGNETADKGLYIKRMQSLAGQTIPIIARAPGLKAVEGQTLSELQNAIDGVDEKFVHAYEILVQTKDVRKAIVAFTGEAVSVSASEKISSLTASGQLRRRTTKRMITTSDLREDEFMKKPRAEQLQQVRLWFAKAPETRINAMLVSSVSIVKKMLPEKNVPELIERIPQNGDSLVLLQDVPADKVPELLWGPQGIAGPHTTELFRAEDMDALIERTPRFRQMAKKHPFAVMKDGYQSDAYVALPEHPASLVLYRIITLNPDLYQAARNPAFLALLQDLVMEVLSEELAQKAA